MATQSEEERKRTGQVEQGNAKPGETAKDTTVRQTTPEPPRVPVLAYDLYSDSPAIANRGTGTVVQPAQPAQARPNTGTNYVRPQSPQDRLNESYQNSHNRWEAEKARRAQFRADHEGRNEWQQREHEAYEKRLGERRQRIQQFNDNVRGGNFEGMTRISDDNWSKMGEGSATAQSGWKMNADGKTIALDENGKPIRETSYTVEGKIDHNSEENVKNRAALEEWSKNQWKTNFNNGVAFNRYDGGFDTSKLPKGVFDKDGNLDLSKITSQKQMNALMQIMRQDQEATGAKGRKSNAEQAAAQVTKDLRASGLSDEQIAGLSKAQRIAARDQFKLNGARKALDSFYETKDSGLPQADAMLDARMALREAGFNTRQIERMMGGDDSLLKGRIKTGQARQARDAQTQQEQQTQMALARLRGAPGVVANPAAGEIERSIQAQQAQAAAEIVGGIPTVEESTPAAAQPLGSGDLEAHRRTTEGIDVNENPFAAEDQAAYEDALAQEFAAQQAANRQAQIGVDAENAIPASVRNAGRTPYDPRAAWIARRDALFTRPDIAQSMADLAAGKEAARAAGLPSMEALTRDHVPLLSREQYKSLMSDLPTPTEAAGRAYALNDNKAMAAVMGALHGAEQIGAGFATGSAGARGLRTPTNAQQRRGIAEAQRDYFAQGTQGRGVIELPAPAETSVAQSGVRRARAQAKLDAGARGTQGEGVVIPPTPRQLQAQRKAGAAAQGTRGEGVVVTPAPTTQRQARAKARQEDAAKGARGSGVTVTRPTSAQARAAGHQGSHERNPTRQQKRQAKIQRRAVARESREILESYRNRVERIEVPTRRRAKARKRR